MVTAVQYIPVLESLSGQTNSSLRPTSAFTNQETAVMSLTLPWWGSASGVQHSRSMVDDQIGRQPKRTVVQRSFGVVITELEHKFTVMVDHTESH